LPVATEAHQVAHKPKQEQTQPPDFSKVAQVVVGASTGQLLLVAMVAMVAGRVGEGEGLGIVMLAMQVGLLAQVAMGLQSL
jgi:hypothetical protein